MSANNHEINAAQGRTYLTLFGILSIAILLPICLLNYFLDPYLIHQWDSPLLQRLRPSREKLSPWAKTYAITQYKPEVVFLGNSRTEAGLPAESSLFPGKRIFNGAITGGSLADAMDMARHAIAVSKVETIVWGIDYWSFNLEAGNTEFDKELIARTTYYPSMRALLNIKRTLTVDMTEDSMKMLTGSFGKVCLSSLAFYGQRDAACAAANLRDRGGAAKAIEVDVKAVGKQNPDTQTAMKAFAAATTELCVAGKQVRLYINPTHALMTDTLYWSGQWERMEAWQTALVEMVGQQKRSGCDIRLFDFSGFNSVTTEIIPQVASGKTDMVNYWEASHYRTHVGQMILSRIFNVGADKIPTDFGAEVTTETLPIHLHQYRQARDGYHLAHPMEVALMKTWLTAPKKAEMHTARN